MLDEDGAEEGASVVNDSPRDAVAYVRCVGLPDVVDSGGVEAVPNPHKRCVISTVVAKQSVQEGAKGGYV